MADAGDTGSTGRKTRMQVLGGATLVRPDPWRRPAL
jgi:hypothetical protein